MAVYGILFLLNGWTDGGREGGTDGRTSELMNEHNYRGKATLALAGKLQN